MRLAYDLPGGSEDGDIARAVGPVRDPADGTHFRGVGVGAVRRPRQERNAAPSPFVAAPIALSLAIIDVAPGSPGGSARIIPRLEPLHHRDADAALTGGGADAAAGGERRPDGLFGLTVDTWPSQVPGTTPDRRGWWCRLDIPAMNRMLVEGATHPEVLESLSAELGPAWQAHGDAITGKRSADRSVAALHMIDRDEPLRALRFPGLDERLQTRLGADSRLIDFGSGHAAAPIGPFSQPVRMLTLPEHLCRGIPADAAVALTEQRADGFVFSFGDQPFAYGRHGLDRHREE